MAKITKWTQDTRQIKEGMELQLQLNTSLSSTDVSINLILKFAYSIASLLFTQHSCTESSSKKRVSQRDNKHIYRKFNGKINTTLLACLTTSSNFNHNRKKNYSSLRKTFHIFKKWILQNKVTQHIPRPWHPLMKNSIEFDTKFLLIALI